MTTPRLGAPELTSGQATPETTVNEQIRYIESGAGHFIFKDRDLATPPGSPADGDCYVVAASATGAWAGQDGKIAFRVNSAWAFITPIEGFTAWVNDEDSLFGYDGAAWNVLSSPSGSYLLLTGGTLSGDLIVPDEAYDATAWNGSLEVPTKNAIRDKFEALPAAVYTPPAVSSQSGTSYTAVIGDANTFIRFTSASTVTFTIPPNSSVAFATGTEIHFSQSGAGALSVAAGAGVTINSRSSDLTLAGQYAVAFVKKVASDTWILNGDL